MTVAKFVRRALLFAAVSMLSTSWSPAQNRTTAAKPATATPVNLAITVYSIKPDMVPQWEQFIKEDANPVLQKAGLEGSIWQNGILGQGDRYTAVRQMTNFATLDEPNPFVKALGQEAANKLFAKGSMMFASAPVTTVLKLRDEMSFPKEMGEQHRRLAVVNHIKVVPGRVADFERILLNDVVPAMHKADVNGYQVFETLVGADPNEFHTVTYYNRYADFDKDAPLVRAMGQEGYKKFMAKTTGIVRSMDREVVRYRQDLSNEGITQRAAR